MTSEDVAIIFVHLGTNPAPTLVHAAKFATTYNPNAQLYLITDYPYIHESFPGQILEYSHSMRDPKFTKFVRKNKDLQNISGGYWLYTTERLFALKWATTSLNPRTTILHFESDVLSFMQSKDVQFLKETFRKTAIPSIGSDLGIASTLFSPNMNSLYENIEELLEIFLNSKSRLNDMQLLGLGLKQGILEELPSVPNKGHQFLFDGAAIGQYILGLDPIHADGMYLSGFQEPDFPVKLSEFQYQFEGNIPTITLHYEGKKHKLLTLHNHSKRLLGLPIEDETWSVLLSEANGLAERQSVPAPQLHIHDKKVRLIDRIRRFVHKPNLMSRLISKLNF